MHKPPYELTNAILKQVASISAKLGEIRATHLVKPSPELRKRNRIKTIQSSLAIEGNTLNEAQITALLEQKRVIGPEKDIREVLNAIEVYGKLGAFIPDEHSAFLAVHGILMKGLIESAGRYRTDQVGIARGEQLAHLAPPAMRVHGLMTDLFRYAKLSTDLTLIKSCVFHYEMEFIHPFSDGNGRMGRLWQTLLLMQAFPVFEFLPLETVIKHRQDAYYEALSRSDKAGESGLFIEFMLSVIDHSLEELLDSQVPQPSSKERVMLFQSFIKKNAFSRKDYLKHYRGISPATASRDLKLGVESGILTKEGDKRLARYRFRD